jgi:hypothetical protein
VAYNNVGDCQADDNSVYRVYEGTSNGGCFNMNGSPGGGTQCSEFVRGGAGNVACGNNQFVGKSALIFNDGPANCFVYAGTGCTGSNSKLVNSDYDHVCMGGNWRSMQCKVCSKLRGSIWFHELRLTFWQW